MIEITPGDIHYGADILVRKFFTENSIHLLSQMLIYQ